METFRKDLEDALPSIPISQSAGLSQRLTQLNTDGRKLNDDSKGSESTLTLAMVEINAYAKDIFKDGKILHKTKMSLYECQKYLGIVEPKEENKKVCMRPDGGILFLVVDGKHIPILIVEDKVQGTNDNLHQQKKKRQATGNAIERAGKNIRGAEMIFSGLDIFPYILFASGCDFHSSETISKRIEMMNFGNPNHYINIDVDTTDLIISTNIDEIIPNISIKKVKERSIASVFVKAHKWDTMKHGSSLWKKDEIVKLCCKVLDLVKQSLEKPDT